MARYIDADELIRLLEIDAAYQGDHFSKRDAIRCVKAVNTADVAPKSEEGAECPTCHGTGRIGTTDWLIKGLSKKQLAEEKAKAIAEHEQHIKTEVAREIFARVRKAFYDVSSVTRNELTKAIRDDDQYQIDLVSGIDCVLRAVRGIIEEFAKEYTKGGAE